MGKQTVSVQIEQLKMRQCMLRDQLGSLERSAVGARPARIKQIRASHARVLDDLGQTAREMAAIQEQQDAGQSL